jgi:hypothetical protein
MENLNGRKEAGTFSVAPDRKLYGELTVDGPKSSLYLRDPDFFSTHNIPDRCIHGVLHDLTKVSLLECITTEGSGSATRNNERYSFSRIFPHFIIHGDHHLSPVERVVMGIHFVVDDASTLFYDLDAFAHLLDAEPFINQLVEAQAKAVGREIKIGPAPEILYFTGKREIFSTETIIGRVSGAHSPSSNLGGPNGVQLRNTIFVSIEFVEPVVFAVALDRSWILLRYFELLVGRKQNVVRMILDIVSNRDRAIALEVYWSLRPTRQSSDDIVRKPHPADVLADAVRRPEDFSRVLTNWLSRQESWRDPRLRFSDLFIKEHYDIDRLVGAANIFDILPSCAVPADVALSHDLQKAKEQCRAIFRSLPASPERDSVLNVLGRIGRSNLKQKIRHRARIVSEKVAGRFSELDRVTDEAVNCRNHYVHGSPASFDYAKNFRTFVFLISTLEFVFAVSDLIEAGWDVLSWNEQGSSMSHPFARYRIDYMENLEGLRKLLGA